MWFRDTQEGGNTINKSNAVTDTNGRHRRHSGVQHSWDSQGRKDQTVTALTAAVCQTTQTFTVFLTHFTHKKRR